jgi:hypothetical protein
MMARPTTRQLAARKAWATRRAKRVEEEKQKRRRFEAARRGAATRKRNRAQALDDDGEFIRVVYDGPAKEFVNLKGGLVILEGRPNIRRVKTTYSNWAPNGSFLAFPFVQYYIHDNGGFNKAAGGGTIHDNGLLHVSFTNSPLSANFAEDTVYFPPIPNIYDTHGVCLARDNTMLESRGNRSMEQFARDIVKQWWSSPFYDSAGWPSYVLIRDTSLRNYDNWIERTKEMTRTRDLSPILKVRWPNGIKVVQLLNKYLSSGPKDRGW